MELGYTGEIYLKSLRRTILRNQFFKVTNKGKLPPMFSLACRLIKNDVEYLSIGISLKKVRANNVGFSTSEITPKKVSGNNVDFSANEITSGKVRANNVEIRQNLVFDVLM